MEPIRSIILSRSVFRIDSGHVGTPFSRLLKLTCKRVNNFIPRGLWILYTGYAFGRIKTRSSNLLNFEIDRDFFNSGPILFHSFTQYGKKEFLKYSVFVLNVLNKLLLA